MKELLLNHWEAIAAVLAVLFPVLLPPVNKRLTLLTGNEKVKIGFAIAAALKDGIQKEEVESLLAALKLSKAVSAGAELEQLIDEKE